MTSCQAIQKGNNKSHTYCKIRYKEEVQLHSMQMNLIFDPVVMEIKMAGMPVIYLPIPDKSAAC